MKQDIKEQLLTKRPIDLLFIMIVIGIAMMINELKKWDRSNLTQNNR